MLHMYELFGLEPALQQMLRRLSDTLKLQGSLLLDITKRQYNAQNNNNTYEIHGELHSLLYI